MYMYSSICSFFSGQLMARPVYNSGPADNSGQAGAPGRCLMAVQADHGTRPIIALIEADDNTRPVTAHLKIPS